VLLAFALALTGAVVSWAGGAKEAGGAATLTFMDGLQAQGSIDYQLFNDVMSKWTAANPSVTVKKDEMSHDEYETKFRTLAAANDLTDFFYINGNQITPLSTAKMLYDMAPDLKADPAWQKAQNPAAMPEWVRGDATYAMPMEMIITHLVFYNQALLQQVGVSSFPTNWADFQGLIGKLASAGYTPIALGDKGKWLLRDPVFGTLSTRVTGTDWYYKTLAHQDTWTNPLFVKALSTLNDLMKIGAFNKDFTSLDDTQMIGLYFNKKAAMFIDGSWAVPQIYQQAPKDVADATRLAVFPAVPGGLGAANGTVTISGWGWGISQKTAADKGKLAAAVSLMKALTSVEYGRSRLEHGLLSAQIVDQFDSSKLDPLSSAFFKMVPTLSGYPHLTIPFPPAIDDTLATGLQAMLTGQSTPDQVAASLQSTWDKFK
jgi:raffinose/stachyose/melibiose transport system substrate-binding protein